MESGGGCGMERALPVPLCCASSQRPGRGGPRGVGGGGDLWFAPLTCWGVRRRQWGYIHRVVLAGTAGASLAVLRGRGSLSVFLLLLLHLLYDFPDLALCSLTGKEMPNDFNDDLLVLIRGLVSWHNDFCTS